MRSKTVVLQMILVMLAVIGFSGMQNEVFGAEVPASDRHPAVNCVYPENQIAELDAQNS